MLEGHGGPVEKQRARIIDIGQAVLKNHPMAQEFLERDVRNITTYFRRKGVKISPQDIMSRLKHERTMSRERNEERLNNDDEEMDSIVIKTHKGDKPAKAPKPLKPVKPGRGKRRVREARAKEENA